MNEYAKRLIDTAKKNGLCPISDIDEVARLNYINELRCVEAASSDIGYRMIKALGEKK